MDYFQEYQNYKQKYILLKNNIVGGENKKKSKKSKKSIKLIKRETNMIKHSREENIKYKEGQDTNIILHYFDGVRGRAEGIRMLLFYLKLNHKNYYYDYI
jgi:hypothetical protein